MPLSDEQKAALKTLADADAQDLADALHTEIPDVHTLVFNQGHRKATADKGRDVRAAEKKLEEAQGEIAKRDERIKELEGSAPDAKKLREQYEQRERETIERHKSELAERDRLLDQKELDVARRDLRARFAKVLLPDAVDAVMAQLEAQGRLRLGENRTVEVTQAGKDIPMSPPEGKDVLDMLADERIAAAPAVWKMSGAEGGGGTQGGVGGSGGITEEEYRERLRRDPMYQSISA